MNTQFILPVEYPTPFNVSGPENAREWMVTNHGDLVDL